VPAPILLASYPVDSIGFNLRISSLSADLETYLDDTNGADLAAMGIRYVILPRGHAAPSGAFFLTNRDDFQLWEIPGPGLLRVVNLIGPVVTTDRSHLAERLLPPMREAERDPDDVQAVDFEGRTAPAATARRTAAAPGRVVAHHEALAGGAVDATVVMERAGTLMLQVNWHPRWTATVDGKAVRTEMAAPTWLAVPVGAGRHQVAFRYHAYSGSWPLVLLAVLALAAGWWLSNHLLPRTTDGPDDEGGEAPAEPGAEDPEPDATDLPEEGRAPRATVRSRRPRAALLVAVAALVVAAGAGCGTVHRLPSPPASAAQTGPTLPVAVRSAVLRSPTVAIPLERALAPDRATVVVFVPPTCAGCADIIGSLRAAAFGSKPFSVLIVGVPLPAPEVAKASLVQGLTIFGLKPHDRGVLEAKVRLGPGGTALVLSPAGHVLRRIDGLRDPAPIIEAATT